MENKYERIYNLWIDEIQEPHQRKLWLVRLSNYEIDLYGVKYLSGNLTWTIDNDENPCVVEIIDDIDSNTLPSLQENCFYLRFNNTDLDTPSFIIMAENIVISYEKKYFSQL